MERMVSSEDKPPDEEEPEDETIEKELSKILKHLMVSSEKGLQRLHAGQVARDLWKFEGSRTARNYKHRSTRDSWVQTSQPDEIDSLASSSGSNRDESRVTCLPQKTESHSLAPLASEEEFCSDNEIKLKHQQCTEQFVPKECCLPQSPSAVPEVLRRGSPLSELNVINDLPESALRSRIAILPGCRDLCGRSVVYMSLDQIKKFSSVTPVQIAQLLMYFHTVPKREVMRLGFLIIVDSREASAQESTFLQQTLSYVEACAPRTVSLVLTYQKQGQQPVISSTSPLHNSSIRFEVITNVNQLLKYVRRTQLLPEYGGGYPYDHEEWLDFHKLLDPFTNDCLLIGQHLLTVMQELKNNQLPASSALTVQMIEHHKKQMMDALDNDQLRHLDTNGENVLKELRNYQRKTPQNQDYRESVEKCNLLYRQLKRLLQRLTKVAEKRLCRLQECMMLKTFEEESSQVLSWLCHKGDETLKKHKVLAENFNGIKEQENEFERFYFLAMQHIERGNDILDETPKPKVASASGINCLASVLRNQLEEFTERLEEAREKLEDTSRCYNILDKCYEWGLDTMRYMSQMQVDSTTSLECLDEVLRNLEGYLRAHPPFGSDTFEEMLSLAKKLKNEALLQQCQVAKKRCNETVELVEARLSTLRKAKGQMECKINENHSNASGSVRSKSYVWMPVTSRRPYTASHMFPQSPGSHYGSQQTLREPIESYTSFPSNYYPAVELRNNRRNNCRKEFFLKGGLVTEDLTSHPLISELANRPTDSSNLPRKSFPFGSSTKSSNASTGSKETLNESVSSSQSAPIFKLKGSLHSLRIFEEALSKVTEEVREQNEKLQQQQLKKSFINEEEESDIDCDEMESPEPQKEKPLRKPVPVNMHLMRCASCSDFEELLSMKNAESEAEKKTKRILKLILREMIQTERDYVKSLEYIIENYIPLIEQNDIPQALRGQRNVLFGNIEKIYEFHNCYFLQELEQCESFPFSVGQCFLKHEPQFYLYALYNKNKPKSDKLMTEYGSTFFKKKQQELGDKMDLASYLLKPVQRMGKYALLLKQVLKECPEKDSDFADLKAAEEMVHFQLRHGNDLLAMDALRDCDVNVKEQGRLLRQDEFLVWQGKSRKALRHIFLFEDLILFSKTQRDRECKGHDFYQYKYSIKMSDIGLTEQVGESTTKFEIWFRKRKAQDVYILQSPSSEVKKAWVQDISKLLWKQALRNRELRLAEMSSMGIGNKPSLDINPSQDQICDRSISLQQLNKAPRFRNSIAIAHMTTCDNQNHHSSNNNRPQSIISVDSTSSGSSASSVNPLCIPSTLLEWEENENRRLSVAQQSQCSAESGIFTDASMSGESFTENEFQKKNLVERSDSILSQASLTTVPADTCPNDEQAEQVSLETLP